MALRFAREVVVGFGWGVLGCSVWLLGMVAWANPEEAKVAAAVVVFGAYWVVVIVGMVGEGRRWR